MNKRSIVTLTATVLMLPTALTACGDSKAGEVEDWKGPEPITGLINVHGVSNPSDHQELELDDNYFKPTFMRVDAGKKLTLDMHNDGAMKHTFTSRSLNVDVELQPGERRSVEITTPPSGTTEFDCTFHQEGGMRGAFLVR